VAGCCECGDEPSGSCATELVSYIIKIDRSPWPCGLRRRSAAALLLRSLVRIPLRAKMFVSYVYILCCPV
jgi:hypothetical protein